MKLSFEKPVFPQKVTRFSISDSILKYVVAKYENEIPWQFKVKCQDDLMGFVENNLLKNLYTKANLKNFKKTGKGFFITKDNVDLKKFIEFEHNKQWKKEAEKILNEKGEDEALSYVVEKLNKRKERAFNKWKRTVEKNFSNEPHFALLILRPLFEHTGKGVRKSLNEPDVQILNLIHEKLKNEEVRANINLSKAYFQNYAIQQQDFLRNGWYYIDKSDKPEKLVSLSIAGGWCTEEKSDAKFYLKTMKNNFYILVINNQSTLAIRVIDFDGETFLMDIVESFNTVPDYYLVDAWLFMRLMKIHATKYRDYSFFPSYYDDDFVSAPIYFEDISDDMYTESYWEELVDEEVICASHDAPYAVKQYYSLILNGPNYRNYLSDAKKRFKLKEGKIKRKDFNWWRERANIFPFTIYFAPDKFKEKLLKENIGNIATYRKFPRFEKLCKLIGVSPSIYDMPLEINIKKSIGHIKEKDLKKIKRKIMQNPLMYNKFRHNFRKKGVYISEPFGNEFEYSNEINEVCLMSWKRFIESNDSVSLDFLEEIPLFVARNESFKKLFKSKFPDEAEYIEEFVKELEASGHEINWDVCKSGDSLKVLYEMRKDRVA